MTQKQKGYVGLGAMLVLAVITVLGSDPLYKAIDTMTAEKVSYTSGTYVGSAQGFGGLVTATVTISGKGIESVELAGDGETPELGGAALEKLAPAFVEAGNAKVDAISGSTVSSKAAIEAVTQALDQASGKIPVIEQTVEETADAKTEATPETEDEAEETVDAKAEATPETEDEAEETVDAKAEATPETEDEAETESKPAESVSYVPGTYEGTAEGFGGEIKAVVTIAEDGIISVELTGDDETPELGGKALEKLPDMFLEAQSAKVDGVSGCTVTSDGAMAAVQAALDQAK